MVPHTEEEEQKEKHDDDEDEEEEKLSTDSTHQRTKADFRREFLACRPCLSLQPVSATIHTHSDEA